MSESTILLKESWQTLRGDIERHLAQYLRLDANCPVDLAESMAYSLMAGGKRLRPVLLLLANEACGGSTEAAMPAACAIEMVHTYSLIHDDLPAMDDDDFRRGQPTNHVRFGEAQAILAGDALLTLAFEVLAQDVHPPDVAAACCAELASAAGASGMVGGQIADLESEQVQSASVDALESIHRRKTGRLICAAATMGGRIAGVDVPTRAALKTYGRCVGLAFQIADDLLDVTGDEQKMGKGVRKDAERGKMTFPSLLGEEASRLRAQSLIEEACTAVAPLGLQGQHLQSLARFVLERDY